MGDTGQTKPGSLADRLNHSFETAHPTDRAPYSNEDVARAVRELDGNISKGISLVPSRWRAHKSDVPASAGSGAFLRCHARGALAVLGGRRGSDYDVRGPTLVGVVSEPARSVSRMLARELSV